MANYKEYDHSQYGTGGIYPLQNPLKRGYGVSDPDVNPAGKQPNARFVNQRNEKLDFWVEDIVANFGMTGSTAQSRNVRQFMPHNIVQPTVTVTGRAPNNYQYNRMASFIRASHWNAINPEKIGDLRHDQTPGGKTVTVNTVRLVIFNGDGGFPYNNGRSNSNHRHVKGVHVPWALEGYVKAMKAGGKRFNQAPQFEFEFFIAESQFSKNLGMWEDTRVYGSELKPWLDWIKRDGGGFVTVSEKDASADTLDSKKEAANHVVEVVEDVVNSLNPF